MKKRISPMLLAAILALSAHAQITSELAYRRFTTQDGLPQMQTERIWQDTRGYIYIGTLSGFVRYDGQSFTPFLKGRRENIVGFAETEIRHLTGTHQQVRALGFRSQWLIEGNEVRQLPIDEKRRWLLNCFNSGDLPDGYILLEDKQEENRRLCRITAEGIEPIARGRALDAMTPDRRIYMDSLTGLHIPTGRILSYRRAGQKLYAFGHDGIYRVYGHTLVKEVAYDWSSATYGLIVRNLPAIHPDGQEPRLVIADEHSLYLFDGKEVSRIASGFNLIKDVFTDRWGRLWLATYEGVYCLFGQHFTNHRLTDEDDIVRALCVNGKGQLVMGTLNGKILFDGHVVSNDPEEYYAPTSTAIGDTVFLAGGSGIVTVREGSLGHLDVSPDQYLFTTNWGGRLIAGSRRQILSIDPATGQTDTLATGIRHPWCAAVDGQGRLWVGSSVGLYRVCGGDTTRVGRQQLVITAMEPTPQGDVLFASADSLFLIRNGTVTPLNQKLPELNGHEIRSLYLSPRGFLIVAAIDGILVSRISTDYRVSDTHWFDHRNGFTQMGPLMAKMAETCDGTVWIAGVEEMTSFKPDQLLTYSQADAFIAPPLRWYEHWWTWMCGAVLLSLIVWLSARRYEALRQARKMEQLRRERKQKDLQIRAIRLKAIPHFHNNVLAAIEYFVLNNSPEEASHYLKLYSDFTTDILQNIDKPARSVEEEVAYVRKYLELEQLRYGERLQFSISIADNVNRQAMLPTMVLHTYCENAVKHGISPKPEGGHVGVYITCHQGDTMVTVEDDGIGRDAAMRRHPHTTRQGLRLLHEQVQLLNKQNRHRICEKVSTLKDANGKITGTRFVLTIPQDFIFN